MGRPVHPPVGLQRCVLHLCLNLLPEVPRARSPILRIVVVAVGIVHAEVAKVPVERSNFLVEDSCVRVSYKF